jgi:hypothetical protein
MDAEVDNTKCHSVIFAVGLENSCGSSPWRDRYHAGRHVDGAQTSASGFVCFAKVATTQNRQAPPSPAKNQHFLQPV